MADKLEYSLIKYFYSLMSWVLSNWFVYLHNYIYKQLFAFIKFTNAKLRRTVIENVAGSFNMKLNNNLSLQKMD